MVNKMRNNRAFGILTITLINIIGISIGKQFSNDMSNLSSRVREMKNEIVQETIKTISENLQIQSEKLERKMNEDQFKYRNEFIRFIQNRGHKQINNIRQSFISLDVAQNIEGIPTHDQPSNFFKGKFEINIKKFPSSGSCEKLPWSGSYWPMEHGLISSRYDGPNNNIGKFDKASGEFIEYEYEESISLIQQPLQFNKAVAERKNLSEYCQELSPAEKWDILVSDKSFGLTNWMKWKCDQFSKDGKIPEWFGICHGWSAASYFYKEPKKPVIYTTPNGIKIKFLPHDIKALVSQFWANCNYETGFVGTTCDFPKPSDIPRDPITNLYNDPKCTSVNPAAFLIILANQVGIRRKNMVVDPFQDNEVWNHPLTSYKLKYYHVINGQVYSKLESNLVQVSQLKDSKDKVLQYVFKHKPISAYYVIGVWFKFTYVLESQASFSLKYENYQETKDNIAHIFLTKNLDVCGGVWPTNNHVQFIWKWQEDKTPIGINDEKCKKFDGTIENINKISGIAIEASNYGLPLQCILNKLIDDSQ
jgi:hypothetical protein